MALAADQSAGHVSLRFGRPPTIATGFEMSDCFLGVGRRSESAANVRSSLIKFFALGVCRRSESVANVWSSLRKFFAAVVGFVRSLLFRRHRSKDPDLFEDA
jgi:hypothetical protein